MELSLNILVPLCNASRSNFSLGECTRSSLRPKPTKSVSIPNTCLNSVPTGTVQFTIDGVNSGAAVALVNGVATSNAVSSLAVGGHSVVAVYGGDARFATSTSSTFTQTVNQAGTTTAVTSSANPTSAGQPVTFSAMVAPVAPGAA